MKRVVPLLFLLFTAAACSTTRVLREGEYRLVNNEIVMEGPVRFQDSELNSYIRQDAQKWSPLICVYNWSRKDGLLHKVGRAPVVYDSTAVASTCENLETRLEYLGYYGSKVSGETTYKGRKARVTYRIRPGKSYLVDSIVYDIPPHGDFPRDFYADTLNSSAALKYSWLSEETLEEESVRSTVRLRNLGYFDLSKNHFSFEADTLADGTATLIYRVKEYTRNETPAAARPLRRYYIGDVTISRPETLPFREKLLLGLNTIHPGDLYSETSVANTYSRLSNIKVFSSVQVQMTPSDSNKVDCGIYLSQSPVQGFKIKAEGSSNSTGLLGFSPQVSFYHKNIFHGGEWFNLAFSGDFQYRLSDETKAIEYGISAGLSLPKFLGLPYTAFKGPRIPRTEINAAYNYQERPEYNRAVVSAAFGYSGVSRGKVSYKVFPLRANFVRLFGLDSGFARTLERNPFMRYAYQDHLDAGLGADFYYNSSEDIVPQGSYTFRRLSLDLSGNAISLFNSMLPQNSDGTRMIAGAPYSQYVRGEFSWGRTMRYGYGNRQAVAMRMLGGFGYAYGNSNALPFEKQFYAGGASSMRGWQARALGPGAQPANTFFSIPSQTGDIKLEANLEYRFGIFWKFEGALFADIGNVWTLSEGDGQFRISDFYKTVAADWGAGLRLNLQFILIRIDFGMQLYDPSREEGKRLIGAGSWLASGNNAFHFGIGYPF